MKKILNKTVKKYGSVLCALAIAIAPAVSQGCFIKFYQPSEPDDFMKIMKNK